ncbi:hypothetical protein BDZ91DRAFT_737386, partial [Kalaharituber pfeilii]
MFHTSTCFSCMPTPGIGFGDNDSLVKLFRLGFGLAVTLIVSLSKPILSQLDIGYPSKSFLKLLNKSSALPLAPCLPAVDISTLALAFNGVNQSNSSPKPNSELSFDPRRKSTSSSFSFALLFPFPSLSPPCRSEWRLKPPSLSKSKSRCLLSREGAEGISGASRGEDNAGCEGRDGDDGTVSSEEMQMTSCIM